MRAARSDRERSFPTLRGGEREDIENCIRYFDTLEAAEMWAMHHV